MRDKVKCPECGTEKPYIPNVLQPCPKCMYCMTLVGLPSPVLKVFNAPELLKGAE